MKSSEYGFPYQIEPSQHNNNVIDDFEDEYPSAPFELPDSIQSLSALGQTTYRETKLCVMEGIVTLDVLERCIQKSLQSIENIRKDVLYPRDYAKILINRELEYIQVYITLYREILLTTNNF